MAETKNEIQKEKIKSYLVNGKTIEFPHKITLENPVDVDTDIELREVVFKKPPTWSDLKHIKGNSTGEVGLDMCIELASKLTGVSKISLGRLISSDGIKITEFLSPFLG